MSIEDKFGFIGWCKEDNHDKIWGYFYRPTTTNNWGPTKQNGWNCCKFWARRGKAMQFQADVTGWQLEKVVSSKLKKGYSKINQSQLFEIWPSFVQEAEAKLMWEILAGTVK